MQNRSPYPQTEFKSDEVSEKEEELKNYGNSSFSGGLDEFPELDYFLDTNIDKFLPNTNLFDVTTPGLGKSRVKETKCEEEKKPKKRRERISYENMTKEEVAEAKKNRRRQQIAKASRLSRAKKKKEISLLKDENTYLKEQLKSYSSLFNSSSDELNREKAIQQKEKEIFELKKELERHKQFIDNFKKFCFTNKLTPSFPEANVSQPNKRQKMSLSGHFELNQDNQVSKEVLALLSESVQGNWKQAIIPEDISSTQNEFRLLYNVTEKESRKILNVRMDIFYPNVDPKAVADFLWTSLSSLSEKIKKQTEDDSNFLCDKLQNLSIETKPSSEYVLGMKTTQKAGAESSGLLQGVGISRVNGQQTSVVEDSKLSVVFSLPEDFKSGLSLGLEEVVDKRGQISAKFANLIRKLGDMRSCLSWFGMLANIVKQ